MRLFGRGAPPRTRRPRSRAGCKDVSQASSWTRPGTSSSPQARLVSSIEGSARRRIKTSSKF